MEPSEHLYDTHFHFDLQKDRFAAFHEIEVHRIYTVAVTNLPDLYQKEQAEIDSKYIRLALGFHPELVHQYRSQIPLMWELIPEARYIGEVGLDYVDMTYKKEQVEFFTELIERCRNDEKKILTIHSRKAVKDVLTIVGKDYKFKPILHWFTGSLAELKTAVEMEYYFSINSAMMASKKFLEVLPLIPNNRILIETDSPFTNYHGTHSKTISNVAFELKKEKPGLDLWQNFNDLLK